MMTEVTTGSARWAASRRLLLRPRSHLVKAFDRLARTEVLELEEGTDLALALSTHAQRGVNLHEALGPLERLGLRRELENRIAGDQLLRFREGSVGHQTLASGEPDT